jgi:hypothetical protein
MVHVWALQGNQNVEHVMIYYYIACPFRVKQINSELLEAVLQNELVFTKSFLLMASLNQSVVCAFLP